MSDFCTARIAHGSSWVHHLELFKLVCLNTFFSFFFFPPLFGFLHQLLWSSRPPLWERRTSGSSWMVSMSARREQWWNSKRTKLVSVKSVNKDQLHFSTTYLCASFIHFSTIIPNMHGMAGSMCATKCGLLVFESLILYSQFTSFLCTWCVLNLHRIFAFIVHLNPVEWELMSLKLTFQIKPYCK